MDWIGEKFKENINDGEYAKVTPHSIGSHEFVKYDGKIIRYLEKSRVSDNNEKTLHYLTIDLRKVTAIVNKESIITIQGKEVLCSSKKDDYIDKTCFPSAVLLRIEDEWNIELIKFANQPDLKGRMIKAFQTLAEYNLAEKPKEAF